MSDAMERIEGAIEKLADGIGNLSTSIASFVGESKQRHSTHEAADASNKEAVDKLEARVRVLEIGHATATTKIAIYASIAGFIAAAIVAWVRHGH